MFHSVILIIAPHAIGILFSFILHYSCPFSRFPFSFPYPVQSSIRRNMGHRRIYMYIIYILRFLSLSLSLHHIVKPTSINITSKPKHFASEIEYSINCEVDGSIPETEIRWTQNNRPFKRGKVSKMWWTNTAYQFHTHTWSPLLQYYFVWCCNVRLHTAACWYKMARDGMEWNVVCDVWKSLSLHIWF